jgi:hypothetical protein
VLARYGLPLKDAVLALAVYGGKVEEMLDRQNGGSVGLNYVMRTVSKAYATVEAERETLLDKFFVDLPPAPEGDEKFSGDPPPEPDEKFSGEKSNDPGSATWRNRRRMNASEIVAMDNEIVRTLIKGFLTARGVSLVYGQPGEGKSLVTLLIAFCVAARMPFNEMKTRGKGLAIYMALEGGGAGFRNRVRALARQYPKADLSCLEVWEEMLDLGKQTRDSDAYRLIKELKALSAQRGLPIDMVILDPLMQANVSGKENTGEELGPLFQNCIRMAALLDTHILIVGHAGKDLDKEVRGWSGQKAAVDTQMLVHDGKVVIQKQRDLEKMKGGLKFEIGAHPVGVDEDGEPQNAPYAVMRGMAPHKGPELGSGWRKEQIVTALRSLGEPTTDAEIAALINAENPKATQVKPASVTAIIKKSLRNKIERIFIRRVGAGRQRNLYGLWEWLPKEEQEAMETIDIDEGANDDDDEE